MYFHSYIDEIFGSRHSILEFQDLNKFLDMKFFKSATLYLLALFNLVHLIFIVWAPYVGFKLVMEGIFSYPIYHSNELSSLSDISKALLNMFSTLIYIGSLISVLTITIMGKICLNTRLTWSVLLTLIPFVLIFIKVLFIPTSY